MIKIKRGLDLPISGQPSQQVSGEATVQTVALLGSDYVGMKPTMAVSEGDQVEKGQLLFTDKKTEGVRYTAPAGGTIKAINRGAKRVFESIEISVAEQESALSFTSYTADQLAGLNKDEVMGNLVESGLWTSLRTRPFGKVPAPTADNAAIFVNAMDTRPLAADPASIIEAQRQDFDNGLQVLPALTSGKVYVCHAGNLSGLPSTVANAEFSGPHPAGLPGTHIHYLRPASDTIAVWTINYQDVIAIGKLFTTGELNVDRVVSIAGPTVKNPRLIKTRVGASLDELLSNELKSGDNRVISGSVLDGAQAAVTTAFLGRFDLQITALAEGRDRPFMGWASAGANRHSVKGIYLSQFLKNKLFAFNTNTNGSPRAIVPISAFEKVMPLDVLPTQLLRALVTGDLELAQQLGALELTEEDLALCTYVCPGKYEYGPILRNVLTQIEKES